MKTKFIKQSTTKVLLAIVLFIAIAVHGDGGALTHVFAAADDRAISQMPAFEGRKGLGVVRAFMFPKSSSTNQSAYDIDPYIPHWAAIMPPPRLQSIKAAGFDFLRIAINPGPVMEAKGEVLAERVSEIKGAIDSSLAAGLKVVVDMHVETTHPLWGFRQITAGFQTPAFQEYLKTIRAMAKLVSEYDPTLVAFELFNEPPPPCDWSDRPDWPIQLAAIYDEARRVAPRNTLLVAGSCWASIDGLMRLDGSRFDSNTMFVFHYYDPGTFTFQGYWGTAKYVQYTPKLPYPPDPTQLDRQLREVQQRIEAAPDISDDQRPHQLSMATTALREYFLKSRGLIDMEDSFEKVRIWAEKNGINYNQIILGEFGVMKDAFGHTGAAPTDRARWLADVIKTTDKFRFAWAVWALSGPSGIITGDINGPLDPQMLGALGLNVQ